MSKYVRTHQNPARDIRILAEIKSNFGNGFAERKIEMLDRLSSGRIVKASPLLDYHESLCYLRAFPDNESVLRRTESELKRFVGRVDNLPKSERVLLDETGIVGTKLNHPYGYFMTRWVIKKFPGAIDLNWDSYSELKDDHMLDFMPVLLTHNENDAVDDPNMPTTDIIEADIAKRSVNRLEWFMKLFERLAANDQVKRLLFDKMELPQTITVADQRFARTHAKMAAREIFYQREPQRKEYPDLRNLAREPELSPRLLSRKEAKVIVDTHKMAMIMRHRELWPLTFSNLNEVYATPIGRGMTIYIMGMDPKWRLPLESNYAALLVRNGVPIGYGIGAMVFDRIEIAINIFETFRGSDAGFIFGKFALLFYQLFGCEYLMIRRYQVGYENPEGLESGAYWFYYRLGFRSIDKKARKLAETEAAKIARSRRYRTPVSILEKLAQSDLCLDLSGKGSNRDVSVGKIALAQTRMISSRFQGDRDRAEREAPKLAMNLLRVQSTAGWTSDEKLCFNRLALFALTIPDLEKWPSKDKRTLSQIMRAKGSVLEQDYVRKLRNHKRLIRAVQVITRG